MLTKAWPHGLEKVVTVEHVDRLDDGSLAFVAAIDDQKEGFIMAFMKHDIEPVEGARVVIQFMRGGPTGGYWKIVREA